MIRAYDFGFTLGGARVTRFRLTNARGAYADILDMGGTVQSLCVPARAGLRETILGFDEAASYENSPSYMGATCARAANRIAGARFALGGAEYALVANDGPNSLHGGGPAFSFGVWEAECDGDRLHLARTSPHGEYGYPGTLRAGLAYELTDDNALVMTFTATTDRPTLYNPCNHCYFRLDDEADVMNTLLWIDSEAYLETDASLIPTGTISKVSGTALDFTKEKPIGRDIGALPWGYDHCLLLNGRGMRRVARVRSERTGFLLEVHTDRPALQLYTANFLNEPRGRGGRAYGKHSAFCLETESCPDAVHHPHFPGAVLMPGETFVSRSAYVFSADN